jgi:para-nitrobenzyl esterase
LLASPAADGLFARAIAQSPALPLIANRETRARQARRFLELLGVGVDEVKDLPQRQLRRAAGELQASSVNTTPTLAFGLTHGVDLLPRHPIDAARAGTVLRVPLIIGTNSHEASMFAWGKPPMLPTTPTTIDSYFERTAPQSKGRVMSAYPRYPRRNALIAIGSDAMFCAPVWAFADAYGAHAPIYVYRFDHTTWTLKVLGLGATHGSEIVHIQHSYSSYLGRKLHPLGRRVQPSVGGRMQRTWLNFATGELGSDWPRYDSERRRTRVIRSARDDTVEDPDSVRRSAWEGLY